MLSSLALRTKPKAGSLCPYLSNTPTNLCIALLNFLLFCFILYCCAFVQYCYVKWIQYNAMHKFVGVLDNPLFVRECNDSKLSWNSTSIVRKSKRLPCRTKFLREFNFGMGDFLCFAGTNFCDREKLVFLAGNQFLWLSVSRLQFGIITFSFYEWKQSKVIKCRWTWAPGWTTCRCLTRFQLINGVPSEDPFL